MVHPGGGLDVIDPCAADVRLAGAERFAEEHARVRWTDIRTAVVQLHVSFSAERRPEAFGASGTAPGREAVSLAMGALPPCPFASAGVYALPDGRGHRPWERRALPRRTAPSGGASQDIAVSHRSPEESAARPAATAKGDLAYAAFAGSARTLRTVRPRRYANSLCVSAGAEGDQCSRDEQCAAPNRCVRGACASTLQDDGSPCSASSECKNSCVRGVCRHTPLPDRSPCSASSECINLCINGTCGVVPPGPIPVPTPTESPLPAPSARCARLDPWDGEVRGWVKLTTKQCESADETGYYLRIAYGQDKETSRARVQSAWSKYVSTYLRGAPCPDAKEMMFFDPSGGAGAGILFPGQPPRWEDVTSSEPDWLLLDARLAPVVEQICFFRASEDRRPLGW